MYKNNYIHDACFLSEYAFNKKKKKGLVQKFIYLFVWLQGHIYTNAKVTFKPTVGQTSFPVMTAGETWSPDTGIAHRGADTLISRNAGYHKQLNYLLFGNSLLHY